MTFGFHPSLSFLPTTGAVSFSFCLYHHSAYVYILLFAFTEISTPFVNLRWFLSHSGLSESPIYLVNGALMVFIFFTARIFPMIPIQAYIVLHNIKDVARLSGTPLAIFYVVGLTAGASLNLYWGRLMAKGLMKLLQKSKTKKTKTA